MAKKWNPGDKIPVDHINELEKKAAEYDRLMSEKEPLENSKEKGDEE